MRLEKALAIIVVATLFGAYILFDFKEDGCAFGVCVPKDKEMTITFNKESDGGAVAPEISTPDGFINTNEEPITLRSYRGKKVVLLDIWTYSCINCQRTIPYLNSWYEKYKDEGLEIVGLHTPEFAFEKVKKNVEQAVSKFEIKYPVVMDNDFSTWQELGNQFWPRKYLIDEDGFIIYDHIGEGAYDETERQIQLALKKLHEKKGDIDDVPLDITESFDEVSVATNMVKSPEVYFGSLRHNLLSNGEVGKNGVQTFVLPASRLLNKLYLSGKWRVNDEYVEGEKGSSFNFSYSAKNVYTVLSAEGNSSVLIKVDGKIISGGDVKDGVVLVNEEGLFHIVSGSEYGEHDLEVSVSSGTVRIFTLTFG